MANQFAPPISSRTLTIGPRGRTGRAFTTALGVLLSTACGPAQSESRGDVDTSAARDSSARTANATPWEEARRRGVEFRAIGQEPGWLLDLDQGRTIQYAGDYGQVRISVPAPEAVRDTAAGTITYTARSDSHDIAIVIREEDCRDVMSGESFTHGVTLRVDGRALQGCGRVLVTGELENIYWKLTELGGEPAVALSGAREAHLRLATANSAVSGSTGCNSLRGRFELSGSRILLGPLATTRMACADPDIARQERTYVAALEAANRAVVNENRLTLQAAGRPVARFEAVYLR